MTATIALVTDADSLPVDHDMPVLLDACAEAGLAAQVCHWDDGSVEWAVYDAVVLRSPWSYVDRSAEFLAWCDRAGAGTRLLNPTVATRWSLDKRYLGDLAARGVPIVPSAYVGNGQDPGSVIAARFDAAQLDGGCDVVIKPTVGAYSRHVQRFGPSASDAAVAHAHALLRRGTEVLVQPYLDAVELSGETDLVFFNGRYSHAIRKEGLLGGVDGRAGEPTLEARSPRTAPDDERAVGVAALAAATAVLGLGEPLLYARVDVIRDGHDQPVVLELEICEPSLNLRFANGSAARFASAIAGRLAVAGAVGPHGSG